MTSTSFGSQSPGLPQSFLAAPCENNAQCRGFGVQNQGVPVEEGAEAQRVKSFSGQYTFKAPAADDFAKGMLPYRATATPGANVQDTGGTTTGLISAIRALLGVSRSRVPSPRDPD